MSVISARLLSILIGYAFGLFQTAYFVGKARGVDIRTLGSGNSGTTNALRNFGKKAGFIVLVGDILKCVFAIVCVNIIFGNEFAAILPLLDIYAGAGTIVGHCFPVYMQFRGGKGVACFGGLVIAAAWPLAILGTIVFLACMFGTKYVSLGSLLGSLSVFIGSIVIGQLGFFHMTQGALIELYFIIFLMVALIWFQHRANIKRLLSGKERKTYVFSSKNETGKKAKS
ncbi:MAG TPA: glycerol-3-phosphate 1-O-acyltransferase PlsY [Lachnospiraceae bacterium]|nr:glycerol-3-phosphate 1-O-acyltransferase PlsY [Lachnospiraceae bacterium]